MLPSRPSPWSSPPLPYRPVNRRKPRGEALTLGFFSGMVLFKFFSQPTRIQKRERF